MMKGVFLSILLLVAVAGLMMAGPAEGMTCGDVDKNLAPCVPYLTGKQPLPASTCCDGVRTLKGMAATTADRRFACNCVKQASARYSTIKDENVSKLPGQCSAPLPFPISLKYDCSKIP